MAARLVDRGGCDLWQQEILDLGVLVVAVIVTVTVLLALVGR
jgi:hypothetical protein